MPAQPPASHRPGGESAPAVMFAGEFRHSLDPKHRVTIPARWRRGDNKDEFFIVPSPTSPCLFGFTPPEFERKLQEVKENVAFPEHDRQVFIRQFSSRAQHCPLDKQGRLLVPDDLCRLADLSGEMLLIGAYRRFELWNLARWSRATENDQLTYQQVANQIGL